MFEKFTASLDALQVHLKKHSQSPKYLLALSGGLDSCVMAHLFHRAGLSCEAAHCNFLLRGEASNADVSFVTELAKLYGFEIHTKKFHTADYAADNGISIQMAARHLRYQWFGELIKSRNLTAVSVAHHANDVAETMLINLVRGSGLAGMHGISAVNGNVIRPLLFASRKNLEEYAKEYGLTWREDASNAEDTYLRNKIRLNIVPQLTELNPSFIDTMVKHAEIMSGYENLLNKFVEDAALNMVGNSFGGMVKTINLEKLLIHPSPEILLYHLIHKYGFNGEVCKEIVTSRRAGAEFFVPGYKLAIGREELFLFDSNELNLDEEWLIHENELEIPLALGSLEMHVVSTYAGISNKIPEDFTDENVAYIDSDKLTFPLKVRHWKNGDYFHPLGMKGKKLISDFFVDEKFSPAQKELVYLLLSGQDIVWVIGHRIDDRFKLTEQTANMRKFTWKKRN